MRIKIVRLFAVLLACIILSIGCDPELATSPILPGQIAVFVITFEPIPVYEGYGNKYRFTLRIDEINGVGARIGSIKIEHVNEKGYVFETNNYDTDDVIRTFGTARIEAYGRLMAKIELKDCYECKLESWLIRADDDQGNHVEYSGTVELIARGSDT